MYNYELLSNTSRYYIDRFLRDEKICPSEFHLQKTGIKELYCNKNNCYTEMTSNWTGDQYKLSHIVKNKCISCLDFKSQ